MENTIYFDNAATTFPKPHCVYEFANDFYMQNGVNAGRGAYSLASKANDLIRETRKQCLEFFHAEGTKKIAFCSSATEALNTVLKGMCYERVKNVYISPFEHNAVLRAIYCLQRIYKFNIIELSVRQVPLYFDVDHIRTQFKEDAPGVVLLSHVSNVCGMEAPFCSIFKLAKEYGANTILDMSQSAGLIDTNLSNMDIDYAVFAGHKTLYAPIGVAGLVLKSSSEIKPLIMGGTGIDSFAKDMPDSLPERLEAGSRNTYAIAGLSAALSWISDTGMSAIRGKETMLSASLKGILKSYPNIHIIGENEGTAIISCTFDGYSPSEIGYVLASRRVAVRTGLHCAPLAHKFLGTLPSGTVRFSMSYFNKESDLKYLQSVLDEISSNG